MRKFLQDKLQPTRRWLGKPQTKSLQILFNYKKRQKYMCELGL